jgi:hypothetical protein
MNDQNEQNEPEDHNDAPDSADGRPLGYWLRVVDGLLDREFAAALDAEGISRRDWMALNVLSGDIDAPEVRERLIRRGKRLRGLEERGWVQEHGDGTWSLTDLGRAERERVGAIVDGIRSRVTGAVGDDAYAAMTASLEAIARELGWDEGAAHRERGFGRPGFGRPGFGRFGGPGFGGGFGPGFGGRPRPFAPDIHDGFGPNLHRGFAPGRPGHPAERFDEPMRGEPHDTFDDGCHGHHPHARQGYAGHGGHRGHGHGGRGGHGDAGHDHGGQGHGHGHGHSGRRSQRAYERGFDAGYARGREAGAA